MQEKHLDPQNFNGYFLRDSQGSILYTTPEWHLLSHAGESHLPLGGGRVEPTDPGEAAGEPSRGVFSSLKPRDLHETSMSSQTSCFNP